MKKSYNIELIEWVDSFGCSPSWREVPEAIIVKPLVCQSVGYVMHEDDNVIVVVPHYAPETSSSDESACGDMTIPKVSIKRRAILSQAPASTRFGTSPPQATGALPDQS